MMEGLSKNILYASYIYPVIYTSIMNARPTALFGNSFMQDQIRKHSTRYNDSSDLDGK